MQIVKPFFVFCLEFIIGLFFPDMLTQINWMCQMKTNTNVYKVVSFEMNKNTQIRGGKEQKL